MRRPMLEEREIWLFWWLGQWLVLHCLVCSKEVMSTRQRVCLRLRQRKALPLLLQSLRHHHQKVYQPIFRLVLFPSIRVRRLSKNNLVGNIIVLQKQCNLTFYYVFLDFGKLDHLSSKIPTEWWLETSPAHKNNRNGKWFAQHGQDVAVAKFFNFKRNGFFVDLAANDAVWASNTFSLEQNVMIQGTFGTKVKFGDGIVLE